MAKTSVRTKAASLRPRVVTAAGLSKGEQEDKLIQMLIKYIPAEIIAFYTFAAGLVLGANPDLKPISLLWIIVVVLVILTPIYLFFSTNVEGKPAAIFHAIAGTICFPVWVYYLNGAELVPDIYNQVYASLLLGFVTLLIPFVQKYIVKHD